MWVRLSFVSSEIWVLVKACIKSQCKAVMSTKGYLLFKRDKPQFCENLQRFPRSTFYGYESSLRSTIISLKKIQTHRVAIYHSGTWRYELYEIWKELTPPPSQTTLPWIDQKIQIKTHKSSFSLRKEWALEIKHPIQKLRSKNSH